MDKIGVKQNKMKKGIKIFLWVLTIMSFFFFVYKVVVFSTSSSYYNFEMDEIVKPTANMILIYSIGAIIGASIIPGVLWLIYGLIIFLTSVRFKKLITNGKYRFKNTKAKVV